VKGRRFVDLQFKTTHRLCLLNAKHRTSADASNNILVTGLAPSGWKGSTVKGDNMEYRRIAIIEEQNKSRNYLMIVCVLIRT
jgi:hypothetical protein